MPAIDLSVLCIPAECDNIKLPYNGEIASRWDANLLCDICRHFASVMLHFASLISPTIYPCSRYGYIRCLSHCVGEAFQNVIFYVSETIDIIYIYKLSTKNFLLYQLFSLLQLLFSLLALSTIGLFTIITIFLKIV